jgi:cytochrome c2
MLRFIAPIALVLSVSQVLAEEVEQPTTDTNVVLAAELQLTVEGDVKAGKSVYKKCKACHSLKPKKNGTGPSLFKILGANAAAVEGYKYSKAMRESGLVWDVPNMTAFLMKPKKLVPGTKMTFSGLKKQKDIDNLLAYIIDKSES